MSATKVIDPEMTTASVQGAKRVGTLDLGWIHGVTGNFQTGSKIKDAFKMDLSRVVDDINHFSCTSL